MEPGTVFMLMNFAALFAVVLPCWLINRVTKRPLLNGWLWGILPVLLLSGHTAWELAERGAFDTKDDFKQGERFGEYVTGPALFPLALAAWRGRRHLREKREYREWLERKSAGASPHNGAVEQ